MRKRPTPLTVELEAALVRELRSTYQDLNASDFRRALRPAMIELSDATGRLGRWRSDVRSIEIARSLAVEQPWGVVVEVLKHEMAHQYVHEILGQTTETSHGPAFREVCQRLGIDGTAAGMPAPASGASGASGIAGVSGDDARILERIARLLALAESSNANEAQAAMNAAQRLMLKHNLDAAKAQTPRGYGYRHLGTPTGRVAESERILAAILSQHFFVEGIWVPVYRAAEQKRGSVLEICGTPSNLEMAAYAHAFLTHTSDQLWRDHQRQAGIRSNRDRRTYLAGVMTGFLERLNAEKTRNREQGLVWVRDADLSDYYRRRHPHIQRVKHVGSRRTEAHAHGRAAGRKIVLHRPVEGKSGTATRLLRPRSG
jgi:hypothetical protein